MAVVIPSICYEVFLMVVLEAFREGTPVIGRDLGAFPEIIEQSGAGLLFDDAVDLAQGLSRLSADGALRAQLGQAARAAAATPWSETVAIDRYLDLVAQLARARGREDVLTRLGRP